MFFFVILSMLVLVTLPFFSPVTVVLDLSVDDLLVIAQHALGSYAVIVDFVVVLPLLPYASFAASIVLHVSSFVSRRVVYPFIDKVIAPCISLVLFLLACTACDFCVRACITLVTLGMELFAFLLLPPLRWFGQSSYALSVSSGTLDATVGDETVVQLGSIESSRIQQTRAVGTSTPRKQPVVRPKSSAPPPRTFTPEALAWEKAVLEAWFSALRSPDFHATFERNLALYKSGKVAGRLAETKSA
ncbi:hypothetical protein FRC08_013709 [Ceratobasidium sp. 394]|nr:hypothetical protein FRC08_013709 [Ceratobasidium sp. 394]